MIREYDEDAELDRYVWSHHLGHFTAFERAVQRAWHVEQKAAHAGEPTTRLMRRHGGVAGDPAITAALAGGWATFRSEARVRVLREHGDTVVVNRCPACRRVVMTSRARQCLWCGHDWHAR